MANSEKKIHENKTTYHRCRQAFTTQLVALSIIILLSIINLVIHVGRVEAKTLYVNRTTGNDGTSYESNGSGTPWATIGRAAWGSTNRSAPNSGQAAKPGDMVLVAEGTYSLSVTGGNRTDPLYNPVNNGTSGNHITFRADGNVKIESPLWTGPAIGALNRSYITWDGFYLDEWQINTTSDTGPVVVWASSNIHLLNLRIKGHNLFGGNHTGIRFEQSNNSIARNCTIYDISAPTGAGQNEAGIMLYDSNDISIENNEIYNTGAGVYIKGVHTGFTQERNIVRYNYLYNLTHAGVVIASSVNARIYQNIIKTIPYAAFDIWTIGTHYGNMIINNTVYNAPNDYAVILRGDRHDSTIQNNIFYTNSSSVVIGTWAISPTTPGSMVVEHNLYYNFSSNKFSDLGGNNTFDVWKSTWGRDAAYPQSAISDPQFINIGNSDFRLQTGSPARNLGVDILNLAGRGTSAVIPAGAYITGTETIGIISGGGTTIKTPMAPGGMRITN